MLDVGGGDSPHSRADLVVDKYVADNFERERDISLTKPLVVGDGEHLPLTDHAFDYVVASHVLEHAIDPMRFAAELSRVGRAGFVQVPSRLSELTFGWAFHPWLVDREGDALVFHPRDGRAAPCGDFFHQMYRRSPLMQAWFEAYQSEWRFSVHWQGRLEVRVEGASRAPQTASFDLERSVALLEGAESQGRLTPLPPDLAGLLRCPACGSELRLADGRATCAGCERSYRMAGSVPLLIEEAAL